MSTQKPMSGRIQVTRRTFLKGSCAAFVTSVWLPGCSDHGRGSSSSVTSQAATAAGGTTYWADDFHRADGAPGNGWQSVNRATAQIVEQVLRRTDQGDYRIYYNMAGGGLPADYYVNMTIPHSLVTSTGVYWGLLGRFDGNNGVKVMWQNSGPRAVGAGHAGYFNDINIVVTGGFPASWDQARDHMVSLGFAGSTVTIYLDGQEYGHFTDTTNFGAGTGVGIVGDAGGTALFNVVSIEVTDSLAIPGPIDLNVVGAIASLTTNSVTLTAECTGGVAPYSYQWHRSLVAGFSPSASTAVSGGATQAFSDGNLTLGTNYFYRVVVTDSRGVTAVSNDVSVVPQAEPLTVGDITQRDLSADTIVVSCEGTSGGTSPIEYQWHRAITLTQTPTWNGASALPNSNNLEFTDTSAVPGRVYSYVMLSRDATGVVAVSLPILAIRYISRLRLGVLGDTCLADHVDGTGRRIPDWLPLYLQSAWGPRDVQVVSHATGVAASGYFAPGSDNYNAAVADFRAAGVTHVFLQYCYDGHSSATDATVRQLAADGFVVLLGQHQYTTQTATDPWSGLAEGIAEEAAAIQAIANGTSILVCDMVSVRSAIAFGRHSTDPSVTNATSYTDAVDLHPSPYGIPILAFGVASGIADALGWRAPTSI